ncbi:AAA family ATPase, partial [Clostridium perfringens]|nr:AAA family ATPase [Clostridium perfringens]
VTNKGFAFIPLINEKVISEREYDNLENNKKEAIVAKASILKKRAEIVLGKLKDIESKSIKKLKEIYSNFLASEMEVYKDEALMGFIDDDNAYEYLEKLFISIEKDIINCYTMDMDEDEEQLYDVI